MASRTGSGANFTGIWEGATPEKQHVKLSDYYESGAAGAANDGAWAYIKRASNKRGRAAVPDDDDADPEGAALEVTA